MAFEIPVKRILSSAQLTAFQSSATYNTIVSYIEVLNASVVGVRLTDPCSESPGINAILRLLDQIEQLAHETPPVENKASRFGNPAFRSFYDKVQTLAPSLHATLPGLDPNVIPELSTYFSQAWGNRERIDYGSGMELNFLCWLVCLDQLQVVGASDHTMLVTRVFWRYIQIMRVLQSTYWLEPAGSHGVWGLDDYHFLPFLFGSAQLRGHRFVRPKAIHDAEIVDELSKDYMYFSCIKFINSIKTASLRWHSPMLDDISAVKTWEKVNSGMIKMYQAEVLGKLPVMQHFLFGSILPYEGPPPPASDEPHRGDGHAHEGWGDCCGIPVPSAFAAAQQEREPGKKIEGSGIRPVPFD
ncbi:Phosphotyrosyl phosphatase activator [Suillus paluster]|uniref:Phosphotyrosyl phosphatase activator n=1 Tax=Suillus paluster TaxID=48578 RepID=UPI001B85EBFA|nr:Phosphotyrosyl phosphatase activator [Suillus paluster]KAG1722686.1 Phosphotyrosyl phosphatase activator [Suillus paluster]